MNNKRLIEITHDHELNVIFTKAHFLEAPDEMSIVENNLQFLIVEKIDEKEAKKVADALAGSREQIAKLESYLKGLKAKGLDISKIPEISKMIKGLKKSIDKAQGDFAIVNFDDSGELSKFMGSKMTAPGITKAAIAMQAKASQFLTGFTDVLQNIEDNIVPLTKGAEKDATLIDLAGQDNFPDSEKLETSIKKSIEKSLKPQGVLAKMKNFFKKNMPGAQGKILKSLPELDADLAAEELTDALMNAPVTVFDAPNLKDTKIPIKDMPTIATDAAESEEAQIKSGTGTSGIIDQIKNMLKQKSPKAAKDLEDSSPEEITAALKDDAEDVLKGKDIESAAKEAAEEVITGPKWSNISKNYVDQSNDKVAAQKVIDALAADKSFQSSVEGKINLKESFKNNTLLSLLYEDVPFNILATAAKQGSDEEAIQDKLARLMANTLSSSNIEVTGMPEKKAPTTPEASATTEKDLKDAADLAFSALKDAVKEEEKQTQTPKDAALGALDSWADGLSTTSQKSLKSKNRIGDLKDIVGVALDDASKAVEGEVVAAIQAWREEHEESLIKSKRFAKKNFDQLESLISKLVASMLKKSNESKFGITKESVKKVVFEFLNRKFYKNTKSVISEGNISQAEKDLIVYRLNKLAGLY
jgi:hypothetical protein